MLRLSFSEMVLGSSFDASGLVLESLNRSCFYYNRQGRTFSSCSADEWAVYRSVTLSPTRTRYSGADSSILDIKLSEYDVNAIKVGRTNGLADFLTDSQADSQKRV